VLKRAYLNDSNVNWYFKNAFSKSRNALTYLAIIISFSLVRVFIVYSMLYISGPVVRGSPSLGA